MFFFQTLVQRFPTWAELRPHLESAEGGKLRVIQEEGARLAVIRYVKGRSDVNKCGPFRSVVWDTETQRPLCVAPVKAREGMPPVNKELVATEDFVDGFMVNAFLDPAGQLRIATRSQLDGANSFYSSKTFAQLFDEALATTPFVDRDGLRQALAAYATDGTAFVSFVVQHPEHRIVVKPIAPALYVVQMGSATQLSVSPLTWPAPFARLQVPSYPVRTFHSEDEVRDLLQRTSVQRGWRWQGLVFKDTNGDRWRLRTPTYTMLRELRGSEATGVERFLRLRSEGKVMEYLKHYGEERQEFWQFEQTFRARTSEVLAAYSDVHKSHKVAFKDLPAALQPAVFQLHLKWRNELRERGFKVRIQNAIDVVNHLRDFEQRRLMEAAAYVAITPVAPPAEGHTTPPSEEEPTAAAAATE
jgi:hypothetical protein